MPVRMICRTRPGPTGAPRGRGCRRRRACCSCGSCMIWPRTRSRMSRRISGTEWTRESTRSTTYTVPAPRPQPSTRAAIRTRGTDGQFSVAAGGSRTWAVTLPKSLTNWACLSWSTTE